MQKLTALLFCLVLVACQTPPPSAAVVTPEVVLKTPYPIMQGATDDSSTVISMMVPANQILSYSIFLDKTLLLTPVAQEVMIPNSLWKMVNMPLTGLAPGALYTIKIMSNGAQVDERFFKTLPKKLDTPKIAVISCIDDRQINVQAQRWKAVFDQKPDMLFMIGDNVYVDITENPVTENDLWRRYEETRLSIDLYKLKTLIPVYATWDDHDYGKNNGDQSFALKNLARNIFLTFFPSATSKALQRGPGVAQYFEWNKNHFLFLDDRSFRTAKGTKPETHFGKEQEEWIFKIIGKQKGVFWLISGDQFFGGYHHFESYEGDHPESFKKFLERLALKKKIVVFVSGDRHIAELMKIPNKKLGYTTYELTSSALHAKVYPGSLSSTPNSLAVFNKDGEQNFLMLTPREASKFRMKSDIHFFGENARTLHEGTLEIQR